MNRMSERLPRGWHRFDVNCVCASCTSYGSTSPYRKVYSEERIRQATRALWRCWLGLFAVMLPATFALSVAAGGWTPFAGAALAAVATGTILAAMTSWWHFRAKR